MTQDQRIRYEQGSLEDGDSGAREDPNAIKPYIDGEALHALVFNRPVDNTYERTEVVRTSLESLKYRVDADPYWIITGGNDAGVGDVPPGISAWDTGTGIFTTDDEIVLQSVKSVGADNKTSFIWAFDDTVVTPVDLQMDGVMIAAEGGDLPELRLEYDSINTGILTITTIGDPITTVHVLVSDDDSINLFALQTAFEAPVLKAILDKLFTRNYGSGNLNTTIGGAAPTNRPTAGTYNFQDTSEREYHRISPTNFADFFTTVANRLSDGDSLGIYYPYLVDPDKFLEPASGTDDGRRQSCVTNANVDIIAAMLFNSTREPEKLADCIPLCKRVGDTLYWVDGTNVSGVQPEFPIYFGESGIGRLSANFFETVTIDVTGASNPTDNIALIVRAKGNGAAVQAYGGSGIAGALGGMGGTFEGGGLNTETLVGTGYTTGKALKVSGGELNNITPTGSGGSLHAANIVNIVGTTIESPAGSFSSIRTFDTLNIEASIMDGVEQTAAMATLQVGSAIAISNHSIIAPTLHSATVGVFLEETLDLGDHIIESLELTNGGATTPYVKVGGLINSDGSQIEGVDIAGTLTLLKLDSRIEVSYVAIRDVTVTGVLGSLTVDPFIQCEATAIQNVTAPFITTSMRLDGFFSLGSIGIDEITLSSAGGTTPEIAIGSILKTGAILIGNLTPSNSVIASGTIAELNIDDLLDLGSVNIESVTAAQVSGHVSIGHILTVGERKIENLTLSNAAGTSGYVEIDSAFAPGATGVGELITEGDVNDVNIGSAFAGDDRFVEGITGAGSLNSVNVRDGIDSGESYIVGVELTVNSGLRGGHGVKGYSTAINAVDTLNADYILRTGCGGHFKGGEVEGPSGFTGNLYVGLSGYYNGVYGEGSTFAGDFSTAVVAGAGGWFQGGDNDFTDAASYGGPGVYSKGGEGYNAGNGGDFVAGISVYGFGGKGITATGIGDFGHGMEAYGADGDYPGRGGNYTGGDLTSGGGSGSAGIGLNALGGTGASYGNGGPGLTAKGGTTVLDGSAGGYGLWGTGGTSPSEGGIGGGFTGGALITGGYNNRGCL